MFTARRLGYALGAEISGLDLSRPLNDDTIAQIRRLWLDHLVLCFPGQDLNPAQLIAFAGRLGELDDNHRIPQHRDPDHQAVMLVDSLPIATNGTRQKASYGQHWHSDHQFAVQPIAGSFLFAKELPEVGGDTMFANIYMAYDTLSAAMRALVDPLQCEHDISLSPSFAKKSPQVQRDQVRDNPPVVHPLVREHEETARKALFVGEVIRNFVGMTQEESQPLLSFLKAHAVRYEFTYRHSWSVGDLVLWDNRCALHHAVADYDPAQPRRMLRCATLAPASGRLVEQGEPFLSMKG
jgi:taurine dioxygenase